MLNQEVFHRQTWNCRKSSHPFLMNWYCYAIGFRKEYEKRWVIFVAAFISTQVRLPC